MRPSSPAVKLSARELDHTNKCPNISGPIVLTIGPLINMPYHRPTIDALHCQTKSCDT
nr:MAG TPA: hypothetical protein [Caudoviricetes sp.]